jgi:hypothetical protein
LVAGAAAWFASAGAGAQTVRTGALEVVVRDGAVVGLTNRAAGEAYVAASGAGGARAALHRTGVEGPWSPPAQTVERRGAGLLVHRQRRADDALTTRFAALSDGTIEIAQEGSGARPGVHGASWALGPVPDRFEILVPGNSGQRFGKDAPYETRVFEYPMGWEAGFVLIQGAKGGALVYARDARLTPKVLAVERTQGAFRLRFESRCEAPFEPNRRVKGVRWVVRAYKGPWQVGAALYRSWAAKALSLKPLASPSGGRTPAWAAGIRFVATVGMDIATIRALAARVIPRRTLLYVPSWRRHEYDRNYPDYEAAPEFGPFVMAAHRLGFRVMPHVNYFGCDPKSPEYERFRRYQMRDPFTKDLLWWDWQLASPPIRFAYINPASKEWRALFVERMKTLRRQYEVDALHLDQTLCIYNDANGRVNGMSCAEGNLALHRDLKQALPEVALSGEGLNEVTCRYEEFAQRHVWGLDHTNGTWSERLLAMAHPVASSVLTPQTTLYGYLGMPNPVAAPGLYSAWMRAYERYGVIPTLPWPTPEQFGANAPAEAVRVLRRAGLFLRYGLTPDYLPSRTTNELFAWRAGGVGRARYVRDGGVALELTVPGLPPLVIERRIEGVERFPKGGSIPGWPAYDRGTIVGLDPRARYDWSPDPPDRSKPHLASVPSGWHVARAGQHADLFRVGLRSHAATARETVELHDMAEAARAGVIRADGRDVAVPGVSYTDDLSGGSVQLDGPGLAMHPPWKGLGAGAEARARPVAYIEYRLAMPDLAGLRFEGIGQIRRGAVNTDGVRYRAVAWPAGETAPRAAVEVTVGLDDPRPIGLDLSAFRGRRIVLRVEVDAGPKGDPTFDWGRIERPRIVGEPDSVTPIRASLGVAMRDTARTVLAARGDTRVTAQAGGARIECDLPNVLTIPFGRPRTVPDEGGVRLADLPLVARTRSTDGIEGPPPMYAPGVGPAACGGDARRAIGEHPPHQGCTLLDYHLKLPASPLRLTTAIGIRDGSKSSGVGFRIEVNGRVVASRDLKPGSGWQPFAADLSAWAGREVVVTLVTDALGEFNFDWAVWAEPILERIR